MGRRARTNCSPIDSAMEKYHNDIGNRLSGVFMPTHPTTDGSEPLSQDFCMLTLDTRHLSSAKSKHRLPTNTINSMNAVRHDIESKTSSSPADSLTSSSYERDASSCTPGEKENIPKEKKSLKEKLALEFIKKKHACARCKRKSRSCVPNKTFSGTQKHYMCGKCRETLNTVKHLFSSQSRAKDSERSVHPSEQSSSSVLTSKSKNLQLPVPRTLLNDSGYETVTSCSTVASAYSAFSHCPTNSNANRDNGDVKSTHSKDQELSSKNNSNTPKLNDPSQKLDANLHTPCACPNKDTTSNTVVNQQADLYQFMGPAQHGSPAGLLRQVKHKNVEEYDGYFPEDDAHKGDKSHSRSALSDVTNSGLPGIRVINVSKPPSTRPTHKACYTCESTTKPCFRLPWEGGWICEDCLDKVH